MTKFNGEGKFHLFLVVAFPHYYKQTSEDNSFFFGSQLLPPCHPPSQQNNVQVEKKFKDLKKGEGKYLVVVAVCNMSEDEIEHSTEINLNMSNIECFMEAQN